MANPFSESCFPSKPQIWEFWRPAANPLQASATRWTQVRRSLSLGHVPPGFDHGLARDFGQNDVAATSPFAMEEDFGDFEEEGLRGEGLQGGVLSCRERRVWDDGLQESVSDLPDRVTRVDRHAASVLHKRKRYVLLDLMGRRQRFV